MATAARALHINVVLDTVCPWCYVGRRRLDKAIALAKDKWSDIDVSVEYSPYQLDSSMGNGLDKQDIYRNKFGARAEQIHQRMAAVGKEEGIEFDFGGKISNTLDSHRLIDYAKLNGGETEEKVVESLMHRYFELAQDIGDIATLVGAAKDAGLDEAKTKAYLESDDGIDTVKQKIKQVQRLGVSGVPFYVINDRYGVSGAESPETFLGAFAKALNLDS
ncbi:hypothetical protein FBU59_006236 [Linderina macrospora]|uniref:Uncharacterized protein n=1 Tax=Linderina macrospora TaxID=4868 RepID=A0ACC1J0B3_9FUNG|nr:hypothetical protein FBU59_006236 [Linderina macrospora]